MSSAPITADAGLGQLVFVSYSRKDANWTDKFWVMLSPLVRQQRLDVWIDKDRLTVGEAWRDELREAIGKSRAALLLVSPDFLASEFIMKEELPALIEQGARLVCALVRPCFWKLDPRISGLQWAHNNSRALNEERNRDKSILGVCEALVSVALPSGTPAGPAAADGNGLAPAKPPAETPLAPLRPGERPGELFGVPALPAEFVTRDEFAGLREALLTGGEGAVGVTGGKELGLYGQGGIGKTLLGVAVARDDEIRRHFPDGVLWVTVGEDADLVAAQQGLLTLLEVDAEVRTADEGVEILTRTLTRRRCLLVVDDVWSSEAAAAFRVAGPEGRVLYTTRDASVLAAVGAEVMPVDVLPERAARTLLAGLAQLPVEDLPPEAGAVIDATGRVALALALVGAAIGRGRMSWSTLVHELERGAETFLAHPYADTFKAMQVSLAGLDHSHADAYLSLAVFPPDTSVPVGAVARHWTHLFDLTLEQTRDILGALAEDKLLSLKDEMATFHDLQHAFLVLQAEDLSADHRLLIAAYRALLSS